MRWSLNTFMDAGLPCRRVLVIFIEARRRRCTTPAASRSTRRIIYRPVLTNPDAARALAVEDKASEISHKDVD